MANVDPTLLLQHVDMLLALSSETKQTIGCLRSKVADLDHQVKLLRWWAFRIQTFETLRAALEGPLRVPYDVLLEVCVPTNEETDTIAAIRRRQEACDNHLKILRAHCPHGVGYYSHGYEEDNWDKTFHPSVRTCYICGTREDNQKNRSYRSDIDPYPFEVREEKSGVYQMAFEQGHSIDTIVSDLHQHAYRRLSGITILI